MKLERASNIEFFRIIAMCMVITVHYFATCNAGANTEPGELSNLIYIFVESFCICGVNMFVLITGYFSTNQSKIKIRKILDLLVDVAFWGGVSYVFCVLFGWRAFSITELIKEVFPFVKGGRWFVKAYIILMLFIPFINKVINQISKESYRVLLIISMILFSVWPSFLPQPPIDDYGYGFIHFILLYLIGAYIKKYVSNTPGKLFSAVGYLISAAFVVVSAWYGLGYAWGYDYLFVILESVFLLLLFSQFTIQSNIINKLAACSFGVFLIHTSPFFSVIVYEKIFHATELMNSNTIFYLISVIVCVPTFYFIGYCLESIKKVFFSVTVEMLLNRIKIGNKEINIR